MTYYSISQRMIRLDYKDVDSEISSKSNNAILILFNSEIRKIWLHFKILKCTMVKVIW